jgi:hypothetical protein
MQNFRTLEQALLETKYSKQRERRREKTPLTVDSTICLQRSNEAHSLCLVQNNSPLKIISSSAVQEDTFCLTFSGIL